jgi:hypothetical protein
MSSRYRCRRTVVVSIVALLGLIPSAQAALPSVEPLPAIASPSATIADGFGTVLSLAELAAQSGKGFFGVPDAIAQLLIDTGSARQLVFDAAGAPTARPQLAALDIYLQTPELTNRVLQHQSATGAFDSSLRYLCADKIYSDLYPNGTGWNNHAYAGCEPGGGVNPNKPSGSLVTNLPVPIRPPVDPGPGYALIPCGGSIANISSMTIGPATATQAIAFSMPTVASLSSFTSLLGRGHR